MNIIHFYERTTPPEQMYVFGSDKPVEMKLSGYKFKSRCFILGWFKESSYVMRTIEVNSKGKKEMTGSVVIPYEYIITTPKWVDKVINYCKTKIQQYVRTNRTTAIGTGISN